MTQTTRKWPTKYYTSQKSLLRQIRDAAKGGRIPEELIAQLDEDSEAMAPLKLAWEKLAAGEDHEKVAVMLQNRFGVPRWIARDICQNNSDPW